MGFDLRFYERRVFPRSSTVAPQVVHSMYTLVRKFLKQIVGLDRAPILAYRGAERALYLVAGSGFLLRTEIHVDNLGITCESGADSSLKFFNIRLLYYLIEGRHRANRWGKFG